MTTSAPVVHPGMQRLREFFAQRLAGRHALTMHERRQSFAAVMGELNPLPPGEMPQSVVLAGRPTERFGAADDDPDPPFAVLYLHGGAFVSGSPATHRAFALDLARRAACPLYLPDYRLAPESPYPAALDDALAAYRELAARYRAVIVAGDSAGGWLALSVALQARQQGLQRPRALVLLSPFVDLTLTAPSCTERALLDPFLTHAGLEVDVTRYVGTADRHAAALSPLFADLAGLPEVLLQVGSDEILFDDAERLAHRLATCGVDVTYSCWPGMVHNWHLFPGWLPEAQQATQEIAGYIVAALPRPWALVSSPASPGHRADGSG